MNNSKTVVAFICTTEYYTSLERDRLVQFSETWMEHEGIMFHELILQGETRD